MSILSGNIVIIDYKMGNLRSVQKAFEKVGFNADITNDPEEIMHASKVVLPGVGAFKDGMKNLLEMGLVDLLNEVVIKQKIPFLGICLGMHLLAERGFENGKTPGLGWVKGDVVRFQFDCEIKKLKIPHVGWNEVKFIKYSKIFLDIDDKSDFYFVHSYHFCATEHATGKTSYGFKFVSAIAQENVYAVQFHPEKSQESGLKLIKNFCMI